MTAITRRDLVAGTAAAGAVAALAGAGVSQMGVAHAEEAASEPDTTVDCDIAVVGAGASGLCTAVQAAQLGANVVCLESQPASGGNINGVEGCFGIGSSMQKEQGIEIDPGATIRSELAASQCRASGLGYVDMVHASGENIDWLIENGVTFGGVDCDKGDIMVFHRFASGTGAADFTQPMTAKAEELGVMFMYETAATSLVKGDNGAVTGVLAEGPDGSVQVNAKAVIVATGGFAQNEELMAGVALNKHVTYGGFPGHDGSGHLMCVDAGARSYRDRAAMLVAFDIEGTPGYYSGGLFAFVFGVGAPYAVWVNQNGERFINEDCAATNPMLMCMPHLEQQESYAVIDSAMLATYAGDNLDTALEQIEGGIEFGSIYKADTIAELAEATGLAGLEATIEEYNGFAAAGSDSNFGKDPSALVAVAEAPFYALRVSSGLNSTIGSIYTDRSFHALDDDMNPIEGLYVVGVEGAMLWSNLYTINVSGGCNANNVNSGRVAAQDACKGLGL